MPGASTEDAQRGIALVGALIRRRQGDKRSAETLPAPKNDGDIGVTFIHGMVQLADGDVEGAAARFKAIVDGKQITTNPIKMVAPLYYGRALAKLGKTDESRKAYDEFLAGWKNADPTVPILVEAKKEYASSFGP